MNIEKTFGDLKIKRHNYLLTISLILDEMNIQKITVNVNYSFERCMHKMSYCGRVTKMNN